MKKPAISVVVITKNEEANISRCLASVKGWADEIIVVDDESTDQTRQLAAGYADKIMVRRMDIEGRHRNWAYAQARNEWVLSLDADEELTPELKEEISSTLGADSAYNAFSIPLRNFIGDYWVRFGGWYPAGKVRLFRRSKFRYEEAEVHPRIELEGSCGHLHCDIIHRGYPDLEHFLSSVNRQTTLEARKWFNTGRRMTLALAVWRAVDRFMRTLIRKKSYRDGLYGFVIAWFAGLYQMLSYVKYCEIKRKEHRQ